MILKTLVLFLLLMVGSVIPGADHGIYVSVFELQIEASSMSTLRIKAFSDDLLNALKNLDPVVQLGEDPCHYNDLVKKYADDSIFVKTEDREIKLNFLDCELIGDTHWLTFDLDLRGLKKLQIETTWFTELFGTQSNIFRVDNELGSRYERLSIQKTEFSIEFY